MPAQQVPSAEQLETFPNQHGHRDYVIETVAALERLGYREGELHLLAERLKGVHEASKEPASS